MQLVPKAAMPFGRYMFIAIPDLPTEYLAELLDNPELLGQYGIREAVETEWRRRGKPLKLVVCANCGKTTDTPVQRPCGIVCSRCAPKL